MMLKVLGLDLSMTASGICFPNGNTSTVATNAKDKDARLVVIRNAVRSAVISTRPDLVVMEEAPPGLKGPAIKAIHMVQGAVRTALLDLEVPYAVVNPSTLKAYATGRKGADKTAMAMAAFKRADREFADDNQCDAWWLRVMGLDWFGYADVLLPVAQRDFMKAVDWPKVPDPVEPVRISTLVVEEYTITGDGGRIVLAEAAEGPVRLSTLLDEGSPVRVGSSDPVPCHFDAR